MCGIYGEFNFTSDLNLSTCLKKMQLIKHRGPDGFGYSYGNFTTQKINTIINQLPKDDHIQEINFFLGHQRLSIIDINDNAFQPMESEDGRFIIIFNGEIYNYIELKDELLVLGHKFMTDHSDTEILLHSFVQWREKCLDRLIGMFAFAIYDRKKNKVFIARDRIGQKPLYYLSSPEKFIFASEINPIIQYTDSKFNLDITALKQYLTLGYVPAPLTIFERTFKLPPACFAWVDLKERTMEIIKFWDVSLQEDHSKSKKEWTKLVHDAIRESVRIRLRADVPLGAFASGGIDSTLIIKSISEVLQDSVDVYAADFQDNEHSIKNYVDIVATKYNLNVKTQMIGLDVVKDSHDVIAVFDEPFDGGSAIAVYKLFDSARGEKKVILTGDGGDELFAGYGRYKNILLFRSINRLLKKLLPQYLFKLLQKNYLSRNNIVNKIKNLSFTDFIHRFDTGLIDLLAKNYSCNDVELIPEYCKPFQSHGINLSIKDIQYMDLKTLLPDRMLYKLDRFSMHYGIEARSPLMDHRVVELAFKIPTKYNVTVKSMKDILKKILRDDFNYSFLYRRKQGFGNPLNHWFRNENSDIILRNLRERNSNLYKYLDYSKVIELIKNRKSSDSRASKNLWRLIVLAAYLEKNKDNLN